MAEASLSVALALAVACALTFRRIRRRLDDLEAWADDHHGDETHLN